MKFKGLCRSAVLAIIATATGCTSHKLVTISSVPAGARIALDGKDAGTAPIQQDLQFKDNHLYDVTATLPGFEDGKATIGYEPPDQVDYQLSLTKKVRLVTRFVEIEPISTDEGL